MSIVISFILLTHTLLHIPHTCIRYAVTVCTHVQVRCSSLPRTLMKHYVVKTAQKIAHLNQFQF